MANVDQVVKASRALKHRTAGVRLDLHQWLLSLAADEVADPGVGVDCPGSPPRLLMLVCKSSLPPLLEGVWLDSCDLSELELSVDLVFVNGDVSRELVTVQVVVLGTAVLDIVPRATANFAKPDIFS